MLYAVVIPHFAILLFDHGWQRFMCWVMIDGHNDPWVECITWMKYNIDGPSVLITVAFLSNATSYSLGLHFVPEPPFCMNACERAELLSHSIRAAAM